MKKTAKYLKSATTDLQLIQSFAFFANTSMKTKFSNENQFFFTWKFVGA